jgi:hypothetical protein
MFGMGPSKRSMSRAARIMAQSRFKFRRRRASAVLRAGRMKKERSVFD